MNYVIECEYTNEPSIECFMSYTVKADSVNVAVQKIVNDIGVRYSVRSAATHTVHNGSRKYVFRVVSHQITHDDASVLCWADEISKKHGIGLADALSRVAEAHATSVIGAMDLDSLRELMCNYIMNGGNKPLCEMNVDELVTYIVNEVLPTGGNMPCRDILNRLFNFLDE